MRRRLLVLALATALLCVGCEKAPAEPLKGEALLLDTICTLTLYAPADQDLLNQALAELDRYDKLLSPTGLDSHIRRINEAQGQPTPVDPEVADLIELALDYAALSDGVFDPTIGRVSELWDFGGSPAVPDQEALAAALATVDYRQVRVEGDVITLADPEAHLDLGAIAKGYIADRLAALLAEAGAAAVIGLGGNILIVGEKPDGQPWRIGVDQPFSNRTALVGAITLSGGSVVTSGVYERYFTAEGQFYHHILDPATGYPAKTSVLGVTIVSDSSAVGDALSTICLILGPEKAAPLLETAGIYGSLWVNEEENIRVQGQVDFQEIKEQ